jgi:hypothetical protein
MCRQVERLKKRHPNIYNEINMERRVLVKVSATRGGLPPRP